MSDVKKRVTAIQGIPVSSIPPTVGQVLQFNGTEYVPTTLGLFSPMNISGLQLWLRADRGITVSGGGITNWNDQSGIGDINRNMIQTGSACPTFNSNDPSYNNQPTLSFSSSSSQCMKSVGNWSPTVSEPYTVIIVGNVNDISNNYTFLGGATTGVHRISLYSYISGPNAWQTYNGYSAIVGNPPNTTLPIVFYSEFNGATSSLRISQETPQVTGNDGGNTAMGNSGLALGTDFYNAFFLNGKIAEVIVYNSILSFTNRNNLQNYIGDRYNINIGA